MPTLKQLSYLVAIADEGHFGRAAARARIAQPTLSAQLARLEDTLGGRLVDRARTTVALTPLGQEVAARARRALAEVQGIVDLAQASRGGLGGTLRLGVPPTLGPYLLPFVVPALHARYPRLKLHVREGKPHEIQDQLARGRFDLLLTPLPIVTPHLDVAPLFREPLMAAVVPDHPLARRGRIRRRDLRGESVLTLESGHYLHNQVRDLCLETGATILNDYDGTSLDTLRHMVGMGVGMAFFPALYVLSEIRDRSEIAVLDMEGGTLFREIGLAWRSGNALHGHYRALADLITAEAGRHPGPPWVTP
ncbi:MAG: LysR family transcriptional regulator [Rhodobacterales bacterium]|nr:LysR family transcriptional regulator [Rhodobacterales bacterium]